MVERYMVMFERVKVMLYSGLLKLDTVERFYGYRIRNIVANDAIVKTKKLLAESEWRELKHHERNAHPWKHFIELWHALERHH
jgi:hypothetical protein